MPPTLLSDNMKKFITLTAVAAMTFSVMAACSSDNKATASADGVVEATLADKNAGTDPETTDDTAATLATMDDRQAVIDLHNDSEFRPGKKVERLTILDFNAVWCGPCKQFAPVFEQAAAKFGQTVDFVSIDVDENPATANAFGVRSIPTVVFIYPDGKTKQYVGTQDLLPATRFFALVQGEM